MTPRTHRAQRGALRSMIALACALLFGAAPVLVDTALVAAPVAIVAAASPTPAEAGSYFFGGAASSANSNLDDATEVCGGSNVGAGTPVTAAGTNSKTVTPVSLCTTANAWVSFRVYVISASSSTTRYMLDICSDSACSTVIAPNIYFEPNSGGNAQVATIPLNVAASATLYMRVQGSSGTPTVNVALVGTVRNAQTAPGFNTMTALNANSTTTKCTTVINTQGSGSTTYDTITASTAATYGAFLFIPGEGTSSPANTQAAEVKLAVGAAASEVVIGAMFGWTVNNASPFNKAPGTTIYKSVASGSRVAGQILVSTTGDSGCILTYAFS